MDELIIEKLNKSNLNDVFQVAEIWYNWWGKNCNLTIDDLKEIVEKRCSGEPLPIVYIAKFNDNVIGTINFLHNDAELRHELYPFIGGMYVKNEYRNKGIASKLINTLLIEVSCNFECVYLITSLSGFYEKFGFEFIEMTDANMVNGTPTRERLYKKKFNK